MGAVSESLVGAVRKKQKNVLALAFLSLLQIPWPAV